MSSPDQSEDSLRQVGEKVAQWMREAEERHQKEALMREKGRIGFTVYRIDQDDTVLADDILCAYAKEELSGMIAKKIDNEFPQEDMHEEGPFPDGVLSMGRNMSLYGTWKTASDMIHIYSTGIENFNNRYATAGTPLTISALIWAPTREEFAMLSEGEKDTQSMYRTLRRVFDAMGKTYEEYRDDVRQATQNPIEPIAKVFWIESPDSLLTHTDPPPKPSIS